VSAVRPRGKRKKRRPRQRRPPDFYEDGP